MTARRQFIQWIPAAGLSLMAARTAQALALTAKAALIDEKSRKAVALGYVADATRADKVRFKNCAAGQKCSNCMLFVGEAGDAAGGCEFFSNVNVTGSADSHGAQVAANGWCSLYVKKG